jgi:hypothetical protein
MSSAAGIPTGWHVTQDLIRQIAAADGADSPDLYDAPEKWWAKRGGPEPRYDVLVPALAPTDAARQTLLRRYFDPPAEEGGPIRPTRAHVLLAQLVAAGRVRVVLTTNFDRLIERALDAAGAPPQVLSRPTDVDGMIPLVHAPATVLKLHGDYLSLGLRNTPEELGGYPKKWKALLGRILEEYGLIVVGWSGDYDPALAAAVMAAKARRYPAFWAARKGTLAETAKTVVAARSALVVPVRGADHLFEDLAVRLERLDHAVARRGRVRVETNCSYRPETKPVGWETLPLLMIRGAAVVAPVAEAGTEPIEPEDRERLVDALSNSPLTRRLQTAAGEWPAASSRAVPFPNDNAGIPDDWHLVPGGHQTTFTASYRLGGDASVGLSALCAVRFPIVTHGGHVLVTVDTAISTSQKISLTDLARLIRDTLVTVAVDVPLALAPLLPEGASVTRTEMHLYADRTDGCNFNRPNSLPERVDLSPLGTPTRQVETRAEAAAALRDPLSHADASEIVAALLNRMALDLGYTDPRTAISAIRDALETERGNQP